MSDGKRIMLLAYAGSDRERERERETFQSTSEREDDSLAELGIPLSSSRAE